MANVDIYDKYFLTNQDKSVVFLGQKLIIQIPLEWLRQDVANINQTTVETLGFFKGYIFEDVEETDITKADHVFTMKLPCNMIMKPSHIVEDSIIEENVETDELEKVKVYNLIFTTNDIFMISTSLVQKLSISDKFIYLLLYGQLPNTIKYEEIPVLWQQCASMNGSGNLESNFNTFAIIVMNLARDYNDPTIYFRHVFEKYYEKGIYNAKMIHYWNIPKYSSGFSALIGTNAKYGLTVAMERDARTKGKGNSAPNPIEEAIK